MRPGAPAQGRAITRPAEPFPAGRSLVALAAAALLAPEAFAADPSPVKVVYHLTDGIEQAVGAMRNVRNHLAADPTVKIVVVANGRGIDFLLDGAQDKNGNPFDAIVQDLVTQRVEFRACRFTLEARKIDPSKLLPEATLVPSGVAEAARLQAREGFAYIRP